MAAIENLEQSVFPDQYVRLGDSIETNKVLGRELEGSQALLQLIHEEIQKAVKVCIGQFVSPLPPIDFLLLLN